MKAILMIAAALFFFSCDKDKDSSFCDTYLVIDSTTTPRSSNVAAGIVSAITCYGSNLCYSYTGMEITATASNVFEINARGKISCAAPVCAQALYEVRATISITTAAAGTYYLKFYNNTMLLKTDTITVN